MQDQHDDGEMGLNESRFLIEELNLDDQPTEEEVLERAQELQIDDLILARQSLTKQLTPEWKPYCNRNSEIYYINLQERTAYLDHPIDMMYKIEYAKINGLPVPRFPRYKIQQVAQSLGLIEDQIRNFHAYHHRNGLRVVYEEPSEEEAISTHQKSQPNDKDNQQNQDQLTLSQLQEVESYQRELQAKYQQQSRSYKRQLRDSYQKRLRQHELEVQRILTRRVEEIFERYEDELTQKNKSDQSKQFQKAQAQHEAQVIQFWDNLQTFKSGLEKLREKQRNITDFSKSKNMVEKMMTVQSIKSNQVFQKMKIISSVGQKLKKEFRMKMAQLHQGLIYELPDIVKQLEKFQIQRPQKGQQARRKIFKESRIQPKSDQIQKDKQYKQLKNQINELCLWGEEQLAQGPIFAPARVPSLNLRLRMRIL